MEGGGVEGREVEGGGGEGDGRAGKIPSSDRVIASVATLSKKVAAFPVSALASASMQASK